MENFKDKFSNIIRLTDKQWNHIIKEHPEVEIYKNRLSDVLIKPDLVKRSKRDRDTFLYYRYHQKFKEFLGFRKSKIFETIKRYTKANIYWLSQERRTGFY